MDFYFKWLTSHFSLLLYLTRSGGHTVILGFFILFLYCCHAVTEIWGISFFVTIYLHVTEENSCRLLHVITLHSRKFPVIRGDPRVTVESGFAWQCECLALAPRSLSWWCVNWIARHLQFRSENTTNEFIFRVGAGATSFKNPKCPLDYCPPDKCWFWQTGTSQLFLDCLVGAVSWQKK